MPRIYQFVNGIMTWPGSSKNWTGKAVTGLHVRHEADASKAEKVEYYSGPVTRAFRNRARADKLVKVNSRYSNSWDRIVVAHSNGADVVLDALRVWPFVIESLLLISPAVTSDCSEKGNGLESFVRSGVVRRLELWIGKKDGALRLGKLGVGRLLGYGALGLDGPRNFTQRVTIREEKDFGHSTWFDEAHIEDTLDKIKEL